MGRNTKYTRERLRTKIENKKRQSEQYPSEYPIQYTIRDSISNVIVTRETRGRIPLVVAERQLSELISFVLKYPNHVDLDEYTDSMFVLECCSELTPEYLYYFICRDVLIYCIMTVNMCAGGIPLLSIEEMFIRSIGIFTTIFVTHSLLSEEYNRSIYRKTIQQVASCLFVEIVHSAFQSHTDIVRCLVGLFRDRESMLSRLPGTAKSLIVRYLRPYCDITYLGTAEWFAKRLFEYSSTDSYLQFRWVKGDLVLYG